MKLWKSTWASSESVSVTMIKNWNKFWLKYKNVATSSSSPSLLLNWWIILLLKLYEKTGIRRFRLRRLPMVCRNLPTKLMQLERYGEKKFHQKIWLQAPNERKLQGLQLCSSSFLLKLDFFHENSIFHVFSIRSNVQTAYKVDKPFRRAIRQTASVEKAL